MNAKMAKRLRRQARQMSPSDDVKYTGRPRMRRTTMTNWKGETKPVLRRSKQAIVVNCERATYKKLKQLATAP